MLYVLYGPRPDILVFQATLEPHCNEAAPALRRLPALLRATGVRLQSVRSYGYVEAPTPGFMLPSWVDLGADALAASGRIGPDMAAPLKAEARRRIANGEYFGHIAYMSLVARKPV